MLESDPRAYSGGFSQLNAVVQAEIPSAPVHGLNNIVQSPKNTEIDSQNVVLDSAPAQPMGGLTSEPKLMPSADTINSPDVDILYASGKNKELTMTLRGLIAGRQGQGPRLLDSDNSAAASPPVLSYKDAPTALHSRKARMQATQPLEDFSFARSRPRKFTCDSGATHSFGSVATGKEILELNPGLKLIPSKRFIQVADGSLKPELGHIPVTIAIGKSKIQWEIIIADLGPGFDVILGQDFMLQFGVVLDYNKFLIKMMRVPGSGCVKFPVQANVQHSVLTAISAEDRKVYSPMSAIQFCRDFVKGERLFLVHADPRGRMIPSEIQKQFRNLPERLQSGVSHLMCNSIRSYSPDSPLPETLAHFSSQMSVLSAPDVDAINVLLLNGIGKYDDMTVEDKLETVPAHMRAVVHEFIQVFDDLPDHLPPVRNTFHAIPLMPDAKPPPHRYYRLSPKEKEEVEFQLKGLIKKGFVTPSHSPFGAPILFKDKSDGSFRMCVDFRALNKQTIKNRFPLPRMDSLIDMLTTAKYFTSLDLQQAFPEDREKTAFVTHLGLYEYKVPCFGLANAPATFQSLMNETLDGLLYKNVVAYLDDILIFSKTEEEHVEHVREVLQRLHRDQYYCRIWKCEFNKTKIKFLGWITENGTRSPDPEKVKLVESWPRPVTGEQVRSFLGLAGWFRDYIFQYVKLAEPLQAIIRKPVVDKDKPKVKAKFLPFTWTVDCEKSFVALKRALTAGPVLQLPDMSKPFTVVTDASQIGVGCVLLQDDKPVCFGGRALTAVERRWSVGDGELFGVVYALKTWRHYLDSHIPFTVVTDHNPNIFFSQKTILSGKQARWAEFLEGFDFSWKYEAGETNIADPLSRLPQFASLLYALASVPQHEDGIQYLESVSRLGAVSLWDEKLLGAIAGRHKISKGTSTLNHHRVSSVQHEPSSSTVSDMPARPGVSGGEGFRVARSSVLPQVLPAGPRGLTPELLSEEQPSRCDVRIPEERLTSTTWLAGKDSMSPNCGPMDIRADTPAALINSDSRFPQFAHRQGEPSILRGNNVPCVSPPPRLSSDLPSLNDSAMELDEFSLFSPRASHPQLLRTDPPRVLLSDCFGKRIVVPGNSDHVAVNQVGGQPGEVLPNDLVPSAQQPASPDGRSSAGRTSERVGQDHVALAATGAKKKGKTGSQVTPSDRVLRVRKTAFDPSTLPQELIPPAAKYLPNPKIVQRKNKRRKGFGGVGQDWNQERQFDPIEFKTVEAILGRKFTLDGCSCNGGANALTTKFCCPSNSFFDTDLSGEFVWINSPFNDIQSFLNHYLACKAKSPSTTSACIVLPDWNAEWNELVTHMKLIRAYPPGSELFIDSYGAKLPGTPWGIRVYYDAPRSQFSNA